MSKTCPKCGDDFKSLGGHLSRSSCDYPELSDNQHQIVTGVLMGDGCIDTSGAGKPYLQIESITEPYLQYLDNELGVFSNGVKFVKSAEDSAESNRESGFHQNAVSENYNDVYKLSTMRAPCFEEFLGWYDTGKKEFPEIEVTPTILKHWYACDGSLNTHENSGSIEISAKNERDNLEDMKDSFSNEGLPEPELYGYGYLNFDVESSKLLLEYMGEPLPGFEYKWRCI